MKKKAKKKKKRSILFVQERVESQKLSELLEILEELEKEGKLVDVQICPRCKSPKVRKVGSMSGDLWGHMGMLPTKFECEECGWRDRLVLKATNRPSGIKEVAMIAETSNLKEMISRDNFEEIPEDAEKDHKEH